MFEIGRRLISDDIPVVTEHRIDEIDVDPVGAAAVQHEHAITESTLVRGDGRIFDANGGIRDLDGAGEPGEYARGAICVEVKRLVRIEGGSPDDHVASPQDRQATSADR